jgi:hypothetical protein
VSTPRPLTELELRILAFEGQTWKLRGAKESAIRDEFGMHWIHYYQQVARLIDRPEAEEHNPELVRRLRRMRNQQIKRKYVRE